MSRMIASSITELIGNTPLLELQKYEKTHGLQARLLAKLEFFNPLGSVKDRVGLALIEDAEKRGVIAPGATIIEPTSGNTGIGLAFCAAAKGYHLILTMPDTMSVERQRLATALGARVELTPGALGMAGAIARAEELNGEIPGSIIAGQFDNPANPAVHKVTTAEEIWQDTGGAVDVFIAGVGSGGTISGVGARLKEHNPAVQIIAVEPYESAFLTTGKAGVHKIQGIGGGFRPGNFDESVVDEILTVHGDDAIKAAREVARIEGVFVGISAGAALVAATQVARRPDYEKKTIVALFPDTGERYLSTELWQ